MSALKFILVLPCFLTLAACGGGSSSSSLSNVTPSCSAASTGSITLDGSIKFERVPHFYLDPTKSQTSPGYAISSSIYGLDYSAITAEPARGVTVQILDANNGVITSGSTDSSGNYSLSVPNNTYLKVRVLAQLTKSGTPSWNFSVKDNTSGNAMYSMDGTASCTGTSNETRNLTAASGWTGSSYTETRSAAPFAILDMVYDGIQLIQSVAANTTFPALTLYWSKNNTDTFGNPALGQIGTSYFNGTNAIYILGDENVDTDEYDPSVIAHEWGHYIEANFSRSDSIGGIHFGGDYLDMRVAFGEGYGNAFSSILRQDPWYADAYGTAQAAGFGFNVETETSSNPGWFSETSVEKILYDLYDSTNDSADKDTLSLGFKPIWDVLINEERTDTAFTSIFKFISILKSPAHDSADANAIEALVNAQNIHVADGSGTDSEYGSYETNDAGIPNVLPIYKDVTTSTPATNVCVTNTFRHSFVTNINDARTYNYNVLGMNHYLRFTPPSTGSYKITVDSPTPTTGGDPDIYFYNGNTVDSATSSTVDSETLTEPTLTGGKEYLFEIEDYNILSNFSSDESRCYKVSVVAN